MPTDDPNPPPSADPVRSRFDDLGYEFERPADLDDRSSAQLDAIGASLLVGLGGPIPRHPCRSRGVTLGDPNRPGEHRCLHCGHRWNHRRDARLVDGRPRFCALCHSASWWMPPDPDDDRQRRPEKTDWEAERARYFARRKEAQRLRRIQHLREAAKELGLEVRERPRRERRKTSVTPKVIDPFVTESVTIATEMSREEAARKWPATAMPASPTRPLVPPPPGWEDQR